ncbi:MAG TPA: T9SS type A sorting domain-containing protein, partial [Ignavibacteriaceae bacterium]|nr:T9SS type A sorting domain-containing protein [Ignavibacteriaceae bacterium]
NGSSDLNNVPAVGIGILGTGEDSLLTFASLPGIDTITENEITIGRFVISSEESLLGEEIILLWNFSGNAGTMLTGSDFNNITDSVNHFPQNKNYLTFNKSETNDAETETIFPEKFELLQNYPNPFNPSTTIKYAVQSESFIQIKVYNILGEMVKNLVDQYQSPGVYEINFNAESLPSGYYIYSLFSNEKLIDNKKMILIK